MGFELNGRQIRTIAVIGSGRIGPDIALFFADNLKAHAVPVVVIDLDPAALERGKARVEKKIQAAADKRGKPESAEALKSLIRWTADFTALAEADLVVEAVTENVDVKQKIVSEMSDRCSAEAIFLSCSSHYEPYIIFATAKNPARTAVAHFFFPADKNLVVEIVGSKDTDAALVPWLMEFFELLGKLPVRVRSRYGYAINPVGEALLQLAVMCVERGEATAAEVDAIAGEALGMKTGPFAMANQFGTTPLAAIGLDALGKIVNPWFKTPALMAQRAHVPDQPWDTTPASGDAPGVDAQTRARIANWFLGCYFAVAGDLLESGVVDVGDFDLGVAEALGGHPPVTAINALGVKKALEMVEAFREIAPEFPVPKIIRAHAEADQGFEVPVVFCDFRDDVAVVTIRRPKVLNALNGDVFDQLDMIFRVLKNHRVKAVVLTGFGPRAFVAGADINELAALLDAPNPKQAAIERCRFMQQALFAIENLGKPVVAALNGLALGGGSELAMACTARIGVKGTFPFMGQPEPNLGLIPGAGGTQRLPRLVGFDHAWPILRTGKPISDEKALEIGWADELTTLPQLKARAIEYARELADGKVPVKHPLPKDPVTPTEPSAVDIGHLSKKIDDLLCKAVIEGAGKSLAEGLETEFAYFGDCFVAADGKIGLQNFIENGPKKPAAFTHA